MWLGQHSMVDSSMRNVTVLVHLPPKIVSKFHVEGAPERVIVVFDPRSQIPYASLDEATCDKLVDDELQSTGKAYKTMGMTLTPTKGTATGVAKIRLRLTT